MNLEPSEDSSRSGVDVTLEVIVVVPRVRLEPRCNVVFLKALHSDRKTTQTGSLPRAQILRVTEDALADAVLLELDVLVNEMLGDMVAKAELLVEAVPVSEAEPLDDVLLLVLLVWLLDVVEVELLDDSSVLLVEVAVVDVELLDVWLELLDVLVDVELLAEVVTVTDDVELLDDVVLLLVDVELAVAVSEVELLIDEELVVVSEVELLIDEELVVVVVSEVELLVDVMLLDVVEELLLVHVVLLEVVELAVEAVDVVVTDVWLLVNFHNTSSKPEPVHPPIM